MRRIALGLPLAMGLVCGTYTIVYLVRWEWNRAIIAALFFIAVEVVFVAMVVVDRLRSLEARIDALTARPAPAEPSVLQAISDSAPPPRDQFGWLRDQVGGTNVFLPVLLGAGVLASSLAWVVEHVARSTLSPVRERRLAESLDVLRPPTGGFLTTDVRRSAPPRAGRAVHWLGVVAVLAATGGVTAAAVDFVADRTQSRPDQRAQGVETHIDLVLYGAVAANDPERAFGHLWSVCTGPDVFRIRDLPEPEIDHGPPLHFHVAVPVDVGDRAMDRLRGCLNDTTLDKVQGRVVQVRTSAAS